MRSLLLIFVCALVNSQARTLTEQRDRQLDEISRKPPSSATGVADYSRPALPPPPAPKPNPPVIEMITTSQEHDVFWIVKNYGREEHTLPPPSPKEAPPHHEVTGGGFESPAEWEENKLWKLKNYGRDDKHRPPPTPKEAPPTHQVTGGGVVAPENFGKKGGGLPPPSPKGAPPTHQVSVGGVVAPENYGKEGGGLPPPTHQVSGGSGAAALEQSWPYLLLSTSA
ncbi:hypothetical protein C2S52_005301 [Perilla frutescens var. hirtella]|nr:hypothetical protein C2S52_005301 [Perilla frutescens var. hirtella]